LKRAQCDLLQITNSFLNKWRKQGDGRLRRREDGRKEKWKIGKMDNWTDRLVAIGLLLMAIGCYCYIVEDDH
jgi:hypothetical protein